MTGNEYQRHALRTMAAPTVPYGDLITGALGLTGEAGEVADHVKKWFAQGHGLDKSKIAEELGDVMWYVAVTAAAVGVSLDDVMSENVLKLMKRYPEGFSIERSVNREV